MKIAVIGAGAIGSVVGGLLSKAGEDVTLIGRKSHVDTIRRNGLILDGASGNIAIPVKAAEKLDFKPELALLTVKSQDIESSTTEVRHFLAGVPIVTLQNGVQSDDLVASLLGKENVISSVVVFSASFLEPGKVSYSIPFGKTAVLIGEPFGARGNRLQGISELFDKAMPTEVSDNIRGAHWTKLLWNLNTSVPAVTGLTYKEGATYSKIRKLYISLMREGLKVVTKVGIEPGYLPGFPISPLRRMTNTPQPLSSFLAKRFFSKLPIYGSMYQSIRRGQKTEIDYLNGEIVNSGNKYRVPTPANTLIVDLVHQVETNGKFLTVDELTQRLNRNLQTGKR